MRLRSALALLLAPLALAACGGGGDESTTTTEATTTTASGCAAKEQPPPKNVGNEQAPKGDLDPGKTYEITFVTNCGSLTVELDQKTSPKTTASVFMLATDGFYDGTFFHRIIPGFVVQGGDPVGNGTGGPGYTTRDDVPQDAKYVHGVVAMAKGGAEPAGTAGSQFFVVTGEDVGLPPEYALLGKVTKGLDVVDRIAKLGTPGDQNGTPTEIVVIERAEAKAG